MICRSKVMSDTKPNMAGTAGMHYRDFTIVYRCSYAQCTAQTAFNQVYSRKYPFNNGNQSLYIPSMKPQALNERSTKHRSIFHTSIWALHVIVQ